jgi:hypothetical protein
MSPFNYVEAKTSRGTILGRSLNLEALIRND